MSAPAALSGAYLKRHPGEAAARLETFAAAEAAALLASVPAEDAAGVLARMAPAVASAVVERLPDARAAGMLAALEVHAAGAVLRRLPADRRTALLEAVPPDAADAVSRLLRFRESTVGALVDPFAMALPADMSAAGALAHVRAHPDRVAGDLLVVARDQTLRGAVSLAALIAAPPTTTLGELARPVPVSFPAAIDVQAVAASPAWTVAGAVPVVDAGGRLIGALRASALDVVAGRDRSATAGGTLLHLNELIWSGSALLLGELAEAMLAGRHGGPHDRNR
jgi:magnesium transporter